jgi:hypothetical protein
MGDARPDLNTALLVVADDAHGSLAEFNDAFLLQFLDCLNQTWDTSQTVCIECRYDNPR